MQEATAERRISLRAVGMLAAAPMMQDFVNVMFLFCVGLRAARMGIPPRTQMLIGLLFAVSLTLSVYIAGRTIIPRRALRNMAFASVGVAIVGTAGVMQSSFLGFLACAVGIGIGAGRYFVPFQIRMGSVRPFRAIAWNVAFYNTSWGMGFALGPFAGGWIGGASTGLLVALAWLVTACQIMLIASTRGAQPRLLSAEEVDSEFASTITQRRMGWVAMGISTSFVAGFLLTTWPSLVQSRDYSDARAVYGAFAVGLPYALTPMMWARLRHRLTGPWPIVGLLLLQAGSVGLVQRLTSFPSLLAVIACIGIAASGLTYIAIYYANADAVNHGHSVGINESVIGLAHIVGPLGLGLLAWDQGDSARPFIFGSASLVLAVGAVLGLWFFRRDVTMGG